MTRVSVSFANKQPVEMSEGYYLLLYFDHFRACGKTVESVLLLERRM